MNTKTGFANIIYNASLQVEHFKFEDSDDEFLSELMDKDYEYCKALSKGQYNQTITSYKTINDIVDEFNRSSLNHLIIEQIINGLLIYHLSVKNITNCISMYQSCENDGLIDKTKTDRFFQTVKSLKYVCKRLPQKQIGKGLATIISNTRYEYKRWYLNVQKRATTFIEEEGWSDRHFEEFNRIVENADFMTIKPLYGNIENTLKLKKTVNRTDSNSLVKFFIDNVDITNIIMS